MVLIFVASILTPLLVAFYSLYQKNERPTDCLHSFLFLFIQLPLTLLQKESILIQQSSHAFPFWFLAVLKRIFQLKYLQQRRLEIKQSPWLIHSCLVAQKLDKLMPQKQKESQIRYYRKKHVR